MLVAPNRPNNYYHDRNRDGRTGDVGFYAIPSANEPIKLEGETHE